MTLLLAALTTGVTALALGGPALAGSTPPAAGPVQSREQVVSGSMVAGGYPGPAPAPGGCVAGPYDAIYAPTR